MSMQTPTETEPRGIPPRPLPINLSLPDSESIFHRYSSNHEFPLSVATSVVLHLLVVMVAALASVWLFKFQEPLPMVGVVAFNEEGGGGPGDGSGNPSGLVKPQEATRLRDAELDDAAAAFDPTLLPKLDFDPARLNPKNAARETDDLARGVLDPARTIGAAGRGGPGSGGGRGSGVGVGDGDGVGSGRKSARTLRKERWSIVLPMHDSAQFKNKLAELQFVVLAPAGPGQYRLFRDLSKGQPPESTVESQSAINRLNRIWYTNTDPEVCQGMAAQLGLATPPPYLAIFLPQELELEMARQELAYKNLTEEQIIKQHLETVFDVARVGSAFKVTVREQKPRGK